MDHRVYRAFARLAVIVFDPQTMRCSCGGTGAREVGMLFSPEQDKLKAQIETVILRESEDFFDEPEDLAVLQNTIRIACEFLDFLKRTEGTPELSEAEYMADTIRSGIEDFHTMADWGGILSGLELRKGFGQNIPSTLAEMKEMCDSLFQQLIHSTSSAKGVGLLLSLVQIMLLFMTVYFPSFSSFSASESPS
jgi:hypothetical protein